MSCSYRTVKDYAEVAKLSRIEAIHRFRPWVGPSSGISFMQLKDGREQFAIAIKNFGEIPATNVEARSSATSKMPARDVLDTNSTTIAKYNIGPLLPNMEKHYWLFFESEEMQRARSGTGALYTILYFAYEFPNGGKAGYGIISEFDPLTKNFIHRDMWVE